MLIALLLIMTASCESNLGSLEVYIKRSPLDTENPLHISRVTHIRIRVTGDGMNPVEEVYPFEPGGTSTVPEVPIGKDRVITVEGLAGEDGSAVSRGRSLPMEISSGHHKIELFMAGVDVFSFTPGYGFAQARFGHTTVLSEKGELFLVGGAAAGTTQNPQSMLSSIEVYDPTSGSTTYLTCSEKSGDRCLGEPRTHAAGVAVDEGIVLLGGIGPKGLLSTVELIDTDLLEVETLDNTGAKRSDAVVVRVEESSLVAGGRGSDGLAVDTAELVDSSGDIETLTLPQPRFAMTAAASAGNVVFFGGLDSSGDIADGFFLFKSSTKTFSFHETSVPGRAWASAVPLADGRVVIVGGLGRDGEASTSIDLFEPSLSQICHLGNLTRGRWLASVVRLKDGRLLVIGGLIGTDPGEPTAEVEALDPLNMRIGVSCDDVEGPSVDNNVSRTSIRRYASSAILLPNGVVAVTGGLDKDNAPINQIEVFVPAE
ncbi:MAG: hypothetical protein GY854_04350 [Deltaproteobacteria bacterium]|nr:hypothetical protein [Deltaproteobacteria bacterium]